MKVILGFCAFLGVIAVAGWIAEWAPVGIFIALFLVAWLALVWKWFAPLPAEGGQHGKGPSADRSADR